MRLALALAAALLLPGCLIDFVEKEDPEGGAVVDGPGDGAQPTASGTPTITMHDGRYDPATLRVLRNTTVLFVAHQGTHSVASTNGVYDQGDVQEGTSVSMRADLAGSYTLQCRFHPAMRMSLTVVAD